MILRISLSVLMLSISAYILVGAYGLYKLPDFTTIKLTYTHGLNVSGEVK